MKSFNKELLESVKLNSKVDWEGLKSNLESQEPNESIPRDVSYHLGLHYSTRQEEVPSVAVPEPPIDAICTSADDILEQLAVLPKTEPQRVEMKDTGERVRRRAQNVSELVTLPPDLFLPLSFDKVSQAFVISAYEDFHSVTNSVMHCLVKPVLSVFYAHTDLNGILSTGQMFVLSTNQARTVLPMITHREDGKLGTLLDVGAGDGNVTDRLAPLFNSVTVTEVASKMCIRLKQRYRCFETGDLDKDLPPGEQFDVVSLLNVIDRCPKPHTLLNQVRRRLKPDGRLLLAVPLPIRAAWETKAGKWEDPLEPLVTEKLVCNPAQCCCWEWSALQLRDNFFEPNGFKVCSISRVPYMSKGDAVKPMYILDDALFVLQLA